MARNQQGQWQGPAGAVDGSGRAPFDPGGGGPKLAEPPTQGPAAPVMPPEENPRTRPDRIFVREDRTWRQVPAYVGAVSSDIEVGLGSPETSGVLARKVQLRVRSTHAFDADNYWTVGLYWRDEDGNAVLVSETSTQEFDFGAHLIIVVYANDTGFRLQQNHELTVKFTKTGTPDALVGAQLYSDLYVGI